MRSTRDSGKALRGDERGVALILALLVLALLVMLVFEFDTEARRELKEATVFRDSLRATSLSRAAAQAVRAVLKEDQRRKHIMGQVFDGPTDLWATPLVNFPLGDGVLSGRIEDERGKINLNELANPSLDAEARKARLAKFRRLFQLVQVDPSLVDALADWMDADETPEVNGAESGYYQALKPPYRSANGPLQSFPEIYLVKGFTDEVVRRLLPYVTIYPLNIADSWINLNTADAIVIQAMDLRITPDMAQALVQARPYRTIQGADFVAGFEPIAKALRLAGLYRVTTDTFSASATITVNDVTKVVHLVLSRRGEQGDTDVAYFRIE
jgi:general secretion pathway protein K